jgi:hypothetical protein
MPAGTADAQRACRASGGGRGDGDADASDATSSSDASSCARRACSSCQLLEMRFSISSILSSSEQMASGTAAASMSAPALLLESSMLGSFDGFWLFSPSSCGGSQARNDPDDAPSAQITFCFLASGWAAESARLPGWCPSLWERRSQREFGIMVITDCKANAAWHTSKAQTACHGVHTSHRLGAKSVQGVSLSRARSEDGIRPCMADTGLTRPRFGGVWQCVAFLRVVAGCQIDTGQIASLPLPRVQWHMQLACVLIRTHRDGRHARLELGHRVL